MACFALAHMSCAGAWAWGEVPALLRAAGHSVVAPDLSLRAGVTPADHARELVAAVGSASDVVVAGHSYGGLVALPAAELLTERVRAVVVIDGFVPLDGESGFDLRPGAAAERRAEAAARGDGMWTAGAEALPRMVPFPLSALEAPVRLSGAAHRLPGLYVLCEPETFGAQAERARSFGWRVADGGADHLLPLRDPRRCAELLLTNIAQ